MGAAETGPLQRCLVVGKPRGAKTGEQTKGEIEAANHQRRREAHQASGNAEVGDEPKGFRLDVLRQPVNEYVELRLPEAVEEEVSDDEIGVCCGRMFEGVVPVGTKAHASILHCGFAALVEEAEHGRAGVDGVCAYVEIAPEQSSKEAAVAVSKNEGVSAIEEAGKEVGAGVLESGAEGEVFKPAIGASDAVEVWFCTHRKPRNRSGVRRARSAAARSVVTGIARR